jgi:diacylglycerol O-acyltransferase
MEARRSGADIVALVLLDGAVAEGRMETLISERLLTHRRFRQRVTPRRLLPPRWLDEPSFRLGDHLARVRLGAFDPDTLARTVEQLANQPLDFSRSPWRVFLLDAPNGQSAILVHLHHAMGDGFALLALLLSLADGAPKTLRGAPQFALHERVLASLGGVLRLLLLPFDARTLLHRPLSGDRRMVWTKPVALASLRATADATHATINDTLLAAITSALRAYLAARNELPRALRAIVPVNLRPSTLAFDDVSGNYFGLVFPALPVGDADPRARARAVQRQMGRIKRSGEALGALWLLEALGRIPLPLARAGEAFFARKASVVITNVPGPREPLRLAGRAVNDLVFWAPHPWLGCGFSALSYAGSLRIGVRTDAAIIADPERLVALLEGVLGATGAPIERRPGPPADDSGSLGA